MHYWRIPHLKGLLTCLVGRELRKKIVLTWSHIWYVWACSNQIQSKTCFCLFIFPIVFRPRSILRLRGRFREVRRNWWSSLNSRAPHQKHNVWFLCYFLMKNIVRESFWSTSDPLLVTIQIPNSIFKHNYWMDFHGRFCLYWSYIILEEIRSW